MRPRLDTSKYAIIYPRQSTDDQVKDNIYSLERQMQLRERAIDDGFGEENIIVVDDDLGLSGRSIATRPGFQRALHLMEEKVVAAIYVEDLTRLSRDERTIDQMIIADACERSGTLIYMGRSWYDMRDSGQRQAYKYQAVGYSEYWKAHLIKLHETRKEKARQGKAVTQVPRGYRPNREGNKKDPKRDRLIIHEPEAEVIRSLVARLPLAGSAKELFRVTYPTYWPDGSVLSKTHLNKILRHPIYRGHYVWGDIFVEDAHEPIIAPEEAMMIDRILGENKVFKKKDPPNAGGMLSGLIWCPKCERKMQSNITNHAPCYRCQSHDPRDRDYHFGIHSGMVDDLVCRDLFLRLGDRLINQIIERLETKRATIIQFRGTGESQRKIVQRKIDGFLKSISDPDLPGMARKMVQQQLEQALKDLEAMNVPREGSAQVETDLAFYAKLQGDPSFAAMLSVTWMDESLRWKRNWIRRFIERVEIVERGQEQDIAIHYRDGETRTHTIARRADWSEQELAILHELWEDPARPSRGAAEWLRQGLAERGFKRTRHALYHAISERLRG